MTTRAEDPALSRRQFLVVSAASCALAQHAAAQEATESQALTPAEPSLRPGDVILSCRVNGTPQRLVIDPGSSLLDVLRQQLGLLSVRHGCADGTCGSCTTLVAGKRVPSCLTPAALCHQQDITTLEGLSPDDELTPLQKAFVRHDAVDCGFCIPGQLVAAHALLQEPIGPDPASLAEALCGQQCACDKLPQILAAIASVRSQRG